MRTAAIHFLLIHNEANSLSLENLFFRVSSDLQAIGYVVDAQECVWSNQEFVLDEPLDDVDPLDAEIAVGDPLAFGLGGVDFSSDRAAEVAAGGGLNVAHFRGRLGSGKGRNAGAFTVKDVQAIIG